MLPTSVVKSLYTVVCMKQPTRRISIAMVMEDLKDSVLLVSKAKEEYDRAIQARNEHMIELKAAGVPDLNIMKLTGLSRNRVSRITTQASTAASLDIQRALSNPTPRTYH